MNVYVLGAYRPGRFGDDSYGAVLKDQFVTVWPKHGTHFHRPGDTHFSPGDTEELILGGGVVDLDDWLRYPADMQSFGKRSVMLGAGLEGELKIGSTGRLISVIDGMALRTARDPKSARMLRAAGVRAPVCTCANLSYLLPRTTNAPVHTKNSKPVLGVFVSKADQSIADALQKLESEFEIRRIVYDPEQPNAIPQFRADFRQSDVCITTHLHGVILSVLENIPFAGIGAPGEKVQRECSALEYPLFLARETGSNKLSAAVRDAWSERSILKELLRNVRPQRIRLAERNMELLRAMPPWGTARPFRPPEPQGQTLVIWAAGDEFWDEAGHRLDALGSFDCLMPANSKVKPAAARKRFALPGGALMHWAMMPAEITSEIEKRYEDVVLCHASHKGPAAHLCELARRSGHQVWEYGLWTDSFKAKDGECN
ncbi:MAG: polysaccharide pyruvyl transferase family protein [Acidobacteria bacterium]|nr:polysaccharide pyruvyl transferase family protein [Acidobacteriota bacterium]